MIGKRELKRICARAYIPEHLPWYVKSVSGGEPYLVGDYLAYLQGRRMVFIGYSLAGDRMEGGAASGALEQALECAMQTFNPSEISLVAPQIPLGLTGWKLRERDEYYRLDLGELKMSKKVRYMVRRAARQVSLNIGEKITREHKRLVKDFLHTHPVDEAIKSIFANIGSYTRSESAWVVEARDHKGRLIAFDVADFGAQDYAFYMFNFTVSDGCVPGSSDILLHAIIKEAIRQGKRFLNLGLGIDPGVTFFKTKWGGKSFVPYAHWVWSQGNTTSLVDDVLDALVK